MSGNIAAKYQDVAEWVPARAEMAAGTVVSLDTMRTNSVIASAQAYDTHVAGVVSPQPGLTLGEGGAGKVLVATTGRVKVKVDATRYPVKIGDLLVTSSKPGLAMVSRPLRVGGTRMHRPGRTHDFPPSSFNNTQLQKYSRALPIGVAQFHVL